MSEEETDKSWLEVDDQYTEDMKGRRGGWSLDPGDRTVLGVTLLAIMLVVSVVIILAVMVVGFATGFVGWL